MRSKIQFKNFLLSWNSAVAVKMWPSVILVSTILTLIQSPSIYCTENRKEFGRQQETAVFWGHIFAVETRQSGHYPGQLYVHRITNGEELIVLIYKGYGNLVACEHQHIVGGVKDKEIDLFLDQYFNRSGNNGVEFKNAQEEVKVNVDDISQFRDSLLDWNGAKKKCLRLQESKRENVRKVILRPDVDRSEVSVLSRPRRSLMLPGTTWCGTGNRSTNYESTEGVYFRTDRCCREHDLCNYTIEGFTRKYNLFNYRFHTISHCECDDRFRTCLRMAGDDNSDMVGRLFFNIIRMKCFVFLPETVCLERTWWGKCTREGQQLSASTRDSVLYYETK